MLSLEAIQRPEEKWCPGHIYEPMNSTGHITWINPALLERSWLPEYFAPRFRQVDDTLHSKPGEFLRLGDVVRHTGASTSRQSLPMYRVRRRGATMAIEHLSRADKVTDKESSWIRLPDECVVLDAMVFNGSTAATFWSNKIFGGDAATPRNSYVLVPIRHRDLAWLETVLSDPRVTAQLERAVIGSVLPRISMTDLLEIKVPRLSPEEEFTTSQLIRRSLAKRNELLRLSGASRSSGRDGAGVIATEVPMLTAATFEQRMEQFERLLLEGQLADHSTGFFVQAARHDPESDLFVIRRVGHGDGDASSDAPDSMLRPTDDEDANSAWRQWYWAADSGIDYAVFNALPGDADLPTHLLLRMVATPRKLIPPAPGKIAAPAFAAFRAAIEASRDVDAELDIPEAFPGEDDDAHQETSEIGRLWESLNPGVPPSEQVIAWLRTLFRPVLAIRVLRENRVVGAYLLFGTDQLEDPDSVVTHLELLGERLAAVLRQPSQIAEEAARSESLRRLSWMMHQLSGPLTRIGNVVEELMDFADDNPEVAAMLLPDERRARARADMNELPLEEYTLGIRLGKLEAAVEEIRRLRYLIRRYRNAQGNLQKIPCDLAELLEELAANARGQYVELQVRVECEPSLIVEADRGLIRTALAEVVSNACRECRMRNVTDPIMIFTGSRRDDRARIAIEDNGLPVTESLLPDVFAEDASTYSGLGKGSGLGLAIVRETFFRHGNRCDLEENRNIDGARLPGVTFWAELTVSPIAEDDNNV